MRRALISVAGMGLVAAAVAGPALGASTPPAAPPSAVCPAGTAGNTTATTSNGQVIAGYTLSALAAGYRYQLNSPGLLPVGDAETGNVMEYDVPFSRDTVTGGPVIDALASPVYPGDTAAHLGTAIATFGGPAVPNYPVVADANYGGSGSPQTATFGNGGAVDGQSTAGPAGSTSSAHVSSTSPSSSLNSASGQTIASTDVGSSCVDAVADSETGKIVIAGIIDIDGVHGHAAARSDGTTGVPEASLSVGKVTVAGFDAYIDKDGVHLAAQQPVGSGVLSTVQAQLDKALTSSQMSVKLLVPQTTVKGGSATGDSGGLAVTYSHVLPQVGAPPAGLPPTPLNTVVVYGAAQVSVAGTTAPAPDTSGSTPAVAATGGDTSGGAPAATGTGGAVGAVDTGSSGGTIGSVSGGTPTGGFSPAPGGGRVYNAAPIAARPPNGRSVPLGWLIVGVFGCIVAIGPLLGYARWQLLEGRI